MDDNEAAESEDGEAKSERGKRVVKSEWGILRKKA